VVLLPGATQLQAKDIAWRLKASQADCVVADPETAIKVSHSKKSVGFQVSEAYSVLIFTTIWNENAIGTILGRLTVGDV
jgi:hypothetical protein